MSEPLCRYCGGPYESPQDAICTDVFHAQRPEARGDVEAARVAAHDAVAALKIASPLLQPSPGSGGQFITGKNVVRHAINALARLVAPAAAQTPSADEVERALTALALRDYARRPGGKFADKYLQEAADAIDAVRRPVVPAADRCLDCGQPPAVVGAIPGSASADVPSGLPCGNVIHVAPAAPASETKEG